MIESLLGRILSKDSRNNCGYSEPAERIGSFGNWFGERIITREIANTEILPNLSLYYPHHSEAEEVQREVLSIAVTAGEQELLLDQIVVLSHTCCTRNGLLVYRNKVVLLPPSVVQKSGVITDQNTYEVQYNMESRQFEDIHEIPTMM